MTDFFDDLDEYLAGDAPNVEPIDDRDDASRLLRRIARLDRDAAVQLELYAAERERLEAWKAAELGAIATRRAEIVQVLADYHDAVLRDDPTAKTISTPNGKLKATAQQPEWVFDDASFLAWATEHADDLVRIPDPKPAPDKNAAKAAVKTGQLLVAPGDVGDTVPVFTPGGEVVPGVTVTYRGVSHTIEVTA